MTEVLTPQTAETNGIPPVSEPMTESNGASESTESIAETNGDQPVMETDRAPEEAKPDEQANGEANGESNESEENDEPSPTPWINELGLVPVPKPAPDMSWMLTLPDQFDQDGEVFVGPGALKEAAFLGLGLCPLKDHQKEDLERAKSFAMEQSVKHVLLRQQVSHQNFQMKVRMYAHALSLMSRVYISNVSHEVREEHIGNLFKPFGPIKRVTMSYDGITGLHLGFAFVEYEIPEAAVLANDRMNGHFVGGRNLLVSRPQNVPQAQPVIDLILEEAKQYHRIYIASVHPDLSENDLRSVFEAFGEIKEIQLAEKKYKKGHRGFGYIEYVQPHSVQEAIIGMHDFDLGGETLKVGRSITPPDAITFVAPSGHNLLPSASAVAAAAVTAKISAQDLTKPKDDKELENALGKLEELPPPPPSSILPQLKPKNLVAQLENRPRRESPPPPPALPPPVAEPSPNEPVRRSRRGGFGEKASDVPQPAIAEPLKPSAAGEAIPVALALPPPSLVQPTLGGPVLADAAPQMVQKHLDKKKKKQKKKAAKEKKAILDRLAPLPHMQMPQPGERATFGPTPSYENDEDMEVDEEHEGETFMITGPESSSALAIYQKPDEKSGQLMAYQGKEKTKSKDKKKKKSKSGKTVAVSTGSKRKSKKFKASTLTAMKAAGQAAQGAIAQNMQTSTQNEETSLASQEHVEIRGNDARHMLMHKLMRTNRSSVILLKNMVTKNEIDEYLEEEIREEASKFGKVVDLVIAPEQDSEEVRIFVRFADSTQADAAIDSFDKRYFAGRQVSCTSYDQILFEHEEYAG